jgi:serine/threonine-protein kinase
MRYDEAVKTLQDAGYVVGSTSYGYTSNRPANSVARQTPAAGTELRRGGSVDLLVARPLGSLSTPDLVGKPQADAEKALATFLLVPKPTQDYSASVAKGSVISQAPPAGALINPGDEVTFVVSLGAPPVKVQVPAINGKAQAAAETALREAGLVPAPVTAYSDTIAQGIASAQSPASGASVSPGTNVSFVVSLGKRPASVPTISIPNVVGRAQADAEAALKNVGLVPGVTFAANASTPKGTVFAQSPAAGATTVKGAVVGIVVSLGADQSVTVPDVVGLTSEEASEAIKAVGLVPYSAKQPDDKVEEGKVLSQSPEAGSKVEAGATVLFTISSGIPKEPK